MRAPDSALQAPRGGGERGKATAITCGAHLPPQPCAPSPVPASQGALSSGACAMPFLWEGGGEEEE